MLSPSPSGCLRATSEFLFSRQWHWWQSTTTQDWQKSSDFSGEIFLERFSNDNNRAGSVHICVLARRVSLRPIPQWAALEGYTAVALMAEHDDARQARPMTTIEQAVCTGVRNLRACTRVSLRPIPQWASLEGWR